MKTIENSKTRPSPFPFLRGWIFMGIIVGVTPALLSAAWRKAPNAAFVVGEELIFDVGWKSTSAGEMRMKVNGIASRKNRPAYQIALELSTNRVVDAIFELRNRYESWMDVDSLMSVGSSIQTQEGPRKKVGTVFYDPLTGRYKSRTFRPGKDSSPKNEEGVAFPLAQDIASALYYVRTQPLAVGGTLTFPILNGTQSLRIQIRVLRRDKVVFQGREWPCLVLEPLIETDSGFARNPKVSATLWVTDDARHWPLKLVATTFVGDVGATLRSVK